MTPNKSQIENLRVAKKNLEGKLSELRRAKQRVIDLTRQLAADREQYSLLADSGSASPETTKKLRELDDQISRAEDVIGTTDAATLRLEADLRAQIAVASELYGDTIKPRVDRAERELVATLTPFYSDKSRASSVAARSDCLSYLRAHLILNCGSQIDPVALASWMIRRLSFAINHDGLPWGRHRPETIGSFVPDPEPEAEVAA